MAGGPPIRRAGPVLFVNPRSGDGKSAHAGVAEQARAKGIETVILAPGQDLAALARDAAAAGADALGMAGGGGPQPAVAVRYPAGVAAGPDLLPPSGRLALSASPPPGLPARVMAHFPGTVVASEALQPAPACTSISWSPSGHRWLCPGAGNAPS